MSAFEPSIDRLWERGSLRWQRRSAPDAIPLTIAELDVRTPPFVLDAVMGRLTGTGVGYFDPAALRERCAEFGERVFGITGFAWSRTCSDTLQACRTVVDALVATDGTVVVEEPLYPDLRRLARYPRRRLLTVPAPPVPGAPADWELIATTLKAADCALLCHPHNPLATAWSAGGIDRFLELAARARCAVVVDEVHLPLSGRPSFMSRAACHDAPVVVCTSLSKSIGSSGTKTGFAYANAAAAERIGGVPDEAFPSPDTFGAAISLAFLDHGAGWLPRVRAELDANRAALASFLPELGIGVALAPGVTGLIGWIEDESDHLSRLLSMARVDLLPASHYGSGPGSGWRISYGVHHDILDLVFDRLRQARHALTPVAASSPRSTTVRLTDEMRPDEGIARTLRTPYLAVSGETGPS
ncbi:pyridoxal phosphate-dependent aminotransferase [Micromonospora sp. NPDC049282]|uniref:pyridoxal phosphate-dependent aminotransferase n=1 Tax=Micromonospora sp. NPDC049282 TaxID=3364269 RepID=UPI00371F8159